MIDLNDLRRAQYAVRDHWPDARPRAGLVLGSGWGEAAADFAVIDSIPYLEIPALGQTGVTGHAGRLVRAEADIGEMWIFEGRRHWYEGEGWTPVVLPSWLLHAFGARLLLLTNASGGIRDDLGPGSLMIVEDHINRLGGHPLIGPHRPELGPRFPDQSEVYDRALRGILSQAVESAGAEPRRGVYVAASGPAFETPAEIRAFRAMGADAVGMSTVPEAAVACALGLRVAALSCVCNRAAGLGDAPLSESEVVEAATRALPVMRRVLKRFFENREAFRE
ncbi:purine-nucleoside phosphorylase [Kiritimatiella glycovorans]|uniref:Purine nucleoside phosphorylase n=1 Tax=Kiritimatiella glycovorans TaxID=1307763 RepID=A0A0G3EGQ7_9BACT|nr:purine-nucleoside phosphorylase [Kiritimatiella glycovorans]AKJ65661.1 Purine nucleoside phosphorylase 1 [Kiritimatiella glycovorans]